MGDKHDVDTTMFRRAVWNFVHSLYGIRHDDYNYRVVNQLLERSLMSYSKIVTCFPDRITSAHYHAFMKDFKPSEKVNYYLPIDSGDFPYIALDVRMVTFAHQLACWNSFHSNSLVE